MGVGLAADGLCLLVRDPLPDLSGSGLLSLDLYDSVRLQSWKQLADPPLLIRPGLGGGGPGCFHDGREEGGGGREVLPVVLF